MVPDLASVPALPSPLRRGDRGHCGGFTLVEVMVCIVMLATLTALAAVNLRAGRRGSGLQAALVELASHDRLMRDRSRQTGRAGRLVLDLDAGRVTRIEADADGSERSIPLSAFAGAARVEQVRVVGRRVDRGQVIIACSSAGRAPSYAVQLSAGGSRQWVVAMGLTGRFERVEDDAQVQDIFRHLEADERDRDDPR